MIIGGDQTSKTDPAIETFPADASCSIPPLPEGNLSRMLSILTFSQREAVEWSTPSPSSTMARKLSFVEGGTRSNPASLGAVDNQAGHTTLP